MKVAKHFTFVSLRILNHTNICFLYNGNFSKCLPRCGRFSRFLFLYQNTRTKQLYNIFESTRDHGPIKLLQRAYDKFNTLAVRIALANVHLRNSVDRMTFGIHPLLV